MEKTPLEKACYALLEERAARLLQLIRLDAPHSTIATEVCLVLQGAAALCGETVLRLTAGKLAGMERRRMGYCTVDDCGAELVTEEELEEGLCQHHLQEVDEIDGLEEGNNGELL